jgi:hypothetical protein
VTKSISNALGAAIFGGSLGILLGLFVYWATVDSVVGTSVDPIIAQSRYFFCVPIVGAIVGALVLVGFVFLRDRRRSHRSEEPGRTGQTDLSH